MEHNKILPNEYYAASTIIKNGWFPWIKHVQTFRKILKTEEGLQIYMPVVRSAGKYTYYKIKGDVILSIIKKAGEGALNI